MFQNRFQLRFVPAHQRDSADHHGVNRIVDSSAGLMDYYETSIHKIVPLITDLAVGA